MRRGGLRRFAGGMVQLVRPFPLSPLEIPTFQPAHDTVDRVLTMPAPPRAPERGGLRQPAFSNRARLHALRDAAAVATPTLSPLVLSSPIAKKGGRSTPAGHAQLLGAKAAAWAAATAAQQATSGIDAAPLKADHSVRVASGGTSGLRSRPLFRPPRARLPNSSRAAVQGCSGSR